MNSKTEIRHYCVVCCCDTEHDEENECVECGSALSDLVAEQEVLNFKNEELANENEAMTKALESLGFTQENISVIKSGEFIPQIVSDEKFKAYAVGLFTSDGENGAKDYDDLMEGKSGLSPWEPFDNWSEEDIAREVEKTFNSLKWWFTPRIIKVTAKLEKFECEGCGRTLPESQMSDVMEMYICNRCEDGMECL